MIESAIMQRLETRSESYTIEVEIRRGLFGIRRDAVRLESSEEFPIKEGLSVRNSSGTVWVEDRGMEGKSVKTKRTLGFKGAKPQKHTYRDQQGNYFSYHIPEQSLIEGLEIEIRTPRLRVNAHRV